MDGDGGDPMLSLRLLQMVEGNAEELSRAVIEQVRTDRQTPSMAKLADSELRDQYRQILKRLGQWLIEGHNAETTVRYENLGQLRWEEGIPLHEAVYALQLLKIRTLDHLRGQGFPQSVVEVYGEEELEFAIGQFFDSAVYHLVKGYETSRLDCSV
jgi:hypothetical protein